ncbi:hypothetical protein M422DRAFT_258700 [Sphaerobolus stellatus SS14]|uniref:Uncharacterized protein n=1 Tax=Sphaerobolus stellatus (strain SS14) TaxID=990650 RepID=A0A0C9VAJ7_SPHS4|nr:hypothetical protein M422DRAFT_258700 [Sphaerobolus stellatus SS14]
MVYVHQVHILLCSHPEFVQYLPHNSIVTPAQIVEAAQDVPCYLNAYRDPAVALILFIDEHKADGYLNLKDALGFLRDMHMPNNLHHNDDSKTGQMVSNALSTIFAVHPVQPGVNNGTINSYTMNPTLATFNDRCKLYTNSINIMVCNLYPNPTGILRENLNANLDFFFRSFEVEGCMPLFPYGH